MSGLANVLIASTDLVRTQDLIFMLIENQCTGVPCESAESVLNCALSDQPDLVIVDVSAKGIDGFGIAESLRNHPQTDRIPLVLIGKEKTAAFFARASRIGVEEVFIDPINPSELIHRIRPLFRISTMHAEVDRRNDGARRFGATIDTLSLQIEQHEPKVLFAGPDDGYEQKIRDAIGGPCDVTMCSELVEAEALLTDQSFDACILSVPQTVDHAPVAYVNMCNDIRNNPRLFNLPVLVLAPDAPYADLAEPIYRGGATRVLDASAERFEFHNVLTGLINRQRKRWWLHHLLDTSKTPETSDSLVASYSDAFLKAHLEDQITAARALAKHLSVMYLSVPNVTNVRHEFGDEAGDHLIQQVCQWITRLVRAEDVIAKSGDHEFCVTLPDTPIAEAQFVMRRIAGVIGYTDFAVYDVYQPISVWVEMGAAQLKTNDTIGTMLERAHKGLD